VGLTGEPKKNGRSHLKVDKGRELRKTKHRKSVSQVATKESCREEEGSMMGKEKEGWKSLFLRGRMDSMTRSGVGFLPADRLCRGGTTYERLKLKRGGGGRYWRGVHLNSGISLSEWR